MNEKLESESCTKCTNFHTSAEHYPCLMCIRNDHRCGEKVADFFEKSHVMDYAACEYEWEDGDHGSAKCPRCGWDTNELYFWDDRTKLYTSYSKFCPNCGAKMKSVT